METKKKLEQNVKMLEEELETVKRQLAATSSCAEAKKGKIEDKIVELENKIAKEKHDQKVFYYLNICIFCLFFRKKALNIYQPKITLNGAETILTSHNINEF